MENNYSIQQLNSSELILINGGSSAYDSGYDVGTQAGKCIKNFLMIVAIYALVSM